MCKPLNLLNSQAARFIVYAKNQLATVNRQIAAIQDNPAKYGQSLDYYLNWREQILQDIKTLEK